MTRISKEAHAERMRLRRIEQRGRLSGAVHRPKPQRKINARKAIAKALART